MVNIESRFIHNVKCLSNIVMGAFFLLLMTNVKIDWYPVSFTMQTFAVMMISFIMSSKTAFCSVLLYMAFGIFTPVFTSGFCGIGVLCNSVTSGYLLGFLISSYLATNIDNSKFGLKVFISEVSIFVPGILVLSHFVGMKSAIYSGFIVFIIPEVLKILLLKILLLKKYI